MKMLIFAHHQVVMDGIEEVLRAENVDYVRVDGRSTSLQRNKAIERFTSHANTTVALLSLSACGTGLNLTCASLALMAEVYWTPAALLQAEDRIHRLGQAAQQVSNLPRLVVGGLSFVLMVCIRYALFICWPATRPMKLFGKWFRRKPTFLQTLWEGGEEAPQPQ